MASLSHPLLDLHTTIAWDMDGTLVNGPNSAFFRAYIMAHPEKTHHIVTFRTGRTRDGYCWVGDCPHELYDLGVPWGTIAGVHGVPVRFDLAWVLRHSTGLAADISRYLHWKGRKAAALGATALVDDMLDLVRFGCDERGVALIDAFDPTFPRLETARCPA